MSAASRSWEQSVMAGVLACSDGAAASHLCAAHLHGLAGSKRCRVEISVPRRDRPVAKGLVVHRSLLLLPDDVTRVQAIPVTTVRRTTVDLSGVLSLDQLARVLDDALVRRVVRLEDVRACLARYPAAPGRHPAKLEVLLGERGDEMRLAGSPPRRG